jgi:type III pantothenate kinase
MQVDRPEQVGLDRLFNILAARSRLPANTAALVIDAGTAITVNWLDEAGTFRGGAILPGLGLMARALHECTAQLPRVALPSGPPTFPGTSTHAAMQAGMFWAAAGGVQALRKQFEDALSPAHPREIFLTGGDGWVLAQVLPGSHPPWPEMTLEGVRLAAEALP